MTYDYFIYLYSSLRSVTTVEVAVADGFGDVHGFYFFAARLARLRRGYVAYEGIIALSLHFYEGIIALSPHFYEGMTMQKYE